MALIETLKTIYNRDLNRLRQDIELYKNESNLWKIDKEITNSAGNLCLHLIGNLNAFIGKEIGNIDYSRNRPQEFSSTNIPKAELLKKIDETISIVNLSLDKLTPD